MKVINGNEEALLKETLKVMIDQWRLGKSKKDKLVIKLVHSNFVKEKLVFSMMRSKNKHQTELLKI